MNKSSSKKEKKAIHTESDKKAQPETVFGFGKSSTNEETITSGQIEIPSLDELAITIPMSSFSGQSGNQVFTGIMSGIYTQDQPFYFYIDGKYIPCMRCFIEPSIDSFYIFYWRQIHYDPPVFKTPVGKRNISLCNYNSRSRGLFAKWLMDHIHPFSKHVRGFPPGFDVKEFWEGGISRDERIVFRIIPMHDFSWIYPPEEKEFSMRPYNGISVINLEKPEYKELFTNHERFCEIEKISAPPRPAVKDHAPPAVMPPTPPAMPPSHHEEKKRAKAEATMQPTSRSSDSNVGKKQKRTPTAKKHDPQKTKKIKENTSPQGNAGGSKKRKQKTKKRKQKKLRNIPSTISSSSQ